MIMIITDKEDSTNTANRLLRRLNDESILYTGNPLRQTFRYLEVKMIETLTHLEVHPCFIILPNSPIYRPSRNDP